MRHREPVCASGHVNTLSAWTGRDATDAPEVRHDTRHFRSLDSQRQTRHNRQPTVRPFKDKMSRLLVQDNAGQLKIHEKKMKNFKFSLTIEEIREMQNFKKYDYNMCICTYVGEVRTK